MRFLRRKIGLAGLGVLAAAGLTLLVVLPALASNPGDFVKPASGAGVLPYDVPVGGTGDCANLFTGGNSLGTVKEYDNVNPKTVSGLKSGNNDGVTFDLTMHTANNQQQTLDIASHGGAAIVGIGIKGGTQSTAYSYKHTGAGFVTGDTVLHGPLQSFTTSGGVETGSQFYSISQLSVCYKILSYIQGTVYLDNNQSGAKDSGASPLSGWTVGLYSGVTPGTAGGGTLLSSQTTGASGAYHFDIPADGTHYRVCEVPNGTPPTGGSGVWVETQPLPSETTLCQGFGELAKGYDFTPVSSAGATDDFGNVGGYPCSTAQTPLGTSDYTVGICKGNQQYVFNAGTVTSGAYSGTPFVDYWVGDPNTPLQPTVEQLNFADPIVNGQPKYTKLLYADGGGFPVNLSNVLTMPYCQLDPRDTSAAGYPNSYPLKSPYDTKGDPGSGTGSDLVLPSGATSCVISIRTTAPAPGGGTTGTLQAYVYALGDSGRLPQ